MKEISEFSYALSAAPLEGHYKRLSEFAGKVECGQCGGCRRCNKCGKCRKWGMDVGGGGGLLDGSRTKEVRRKVVQIISRLAELQSVIKLPLTDEESDQAMVTESCEPRSEFSA